MMTHLRFSDKGYPGKFKRAMGSLALRILLIAFVLVVIPLLIHNFILYIKDYHLKTRELFVHYEMLGSAESKLISQNIALRVDELEAIADLADFNHTSLLNSQFNKSAKEQNLSTLFFLNSAFICKASNLPSMLGQDFFKEEAQEALKKIDYAFAAKNPMTGKNELFVMKALYKEDLNLGVLGLSVDAQALIQGLLLKEQTSFPFDLTLLSQEGNLIASSNPSFSLDKVEILSLADWEKMGFFGRLFEKKEKIGAKIPIKDTSLFLLIDFPEKLAASIQTEEFFSRLTVFFILFLILGGGGVLWLSFRMARPLRTLSQDMEKVGEGNLSVRYKKDPMGFEINELGSHFNHMVSSLDHHIKVAEKEKLSKELLSQELEIGHEIQRNLFPKELPYFPGIEIASGFHPAKEVAGDFYDLFSSSGKSQELLLCVADGSGKGISACIYSLLVRSMLRSFYTESSDLQKIVSRTNHLLHLDTKENLFFVTAWLGIYNSQTRELNYSSCGHPPAFLRRKDGKIEELHTPGIAWGVEDPAQFSFGKTILESGDLLLLYTDGIVEAHDKNDNLWGKTRLLAAFQTTPNDANEVVNNIFEKISHFTKGAAQHDDLTLLVVKIM